MPTTTAPLSPRSSVLSALFCGDGVVSGSEECDDGNARGLDGCSEQCRRETGVCGDAVVQAGFGEQCDEGAKNGTPGSSCSAKCRIVRTPTCGDGRRDPGEECDLGAANSDAAFSKCLANCVLPYCGDGVIATGEACDDGNQFALDGCDSDCRREDQLAAPVVSEPGTGIVSPDVPGGTSLPGSVIDIRRIPTPAKAPTGPGLAIFLASGAAAGVGLVRRRLRKS